MNPTQTFKRCHQCGKCFSPKSRGRRRGKFCSNRCVGRSLRGTTHPISEDALRRKVEAKILKEGCGACWIWTGSLSTKGYGQVYWRGKNHMASHISWFLHTGVWPRLFVLHRCDNQRCVNPAHLFLGTQVDNVRDRDLKGRAATGERHPSAKLSEDVVRRIRSSDLLGRELAFLLNVSEGLISAIRLNRIWKNVIPIQEVCKNVESSLY